MPFVFYDFETTGTSPAFDQPTQFAAILTNDNLEPLDRIDIRCRLSPHILPAPWALAVTGIMPEVLTNPELPTWFNFVQMLTEVIDHWGPATWTGFNSISFDEEILRQSLYQNLHASPYLTQMNGNDRLDILKVVYAVRELVPDALVWPIDDRGRDSFKLDRLAPANGFEHHDAHDALGDVEATIYLAELVKDRAPEVWQQFLTNRSKNEVATLLETGQPLRLVERFGASPPRSFIGAFAGRDPRNTNSVGFLDLQMVDPEDLAGQGDQAISAAVSDTPKRIRTLATNKVPGLFPVDAVVPEIARRAEVLANMTDFHQRVGQALTNRYSDRDEPEHVEQKIYSGFFSKADQRHLDRFQNASWGDRVGLITEFNDERLAALGQRVVYLNHPELLDDNTRAAVLSDIQGRWTSTDPEVPWTTFSDVEQQLHEIAEQGIMDDTQIGGIQAFYESLRT